MKMSPLMMPTIRAADQMSNVLFNLKQMLRGKIDDRYIQSMALAQESYDKARREYSEALVAAQKKRRPPHDRR